MKTTLHRDGTVTYWSTLDKTWHSHAQVPDAELAAMDVETRTRVVCHLARKRISDDLKAFFFRMRTGVNE